MNVPEPDLGSGATDNTGNVTDPDLGSGATDNTGNVPDPTPPPIPVSQAPVLVTLNTIPC